MSSETVADLLRSQGQMSFVEPTTNTLIGPSKFDGFS
jgi:hypothetical protein